MVRIQAGENRSLMYPLIATLLIFLFMPPKSACADPDNVFNLGRLHKYLGYGTIMAVAGSIITGAVDPENSSHPGFSYAAMGLGVAACTTGFTEYWNQTEMEDRRNKIHAALGVVATVGFITALALADGDGHKFVGGASGGAFLFVPFVIRF
ncbi:hypothetical protein ACFL4G_03145 [Thermodesulfobacteriota bacterium]